MRPSAGGTRQGAAPPYFGQWESPRRIRGFLAGRDAAQDPLWPASGAETAAEYALWADHLCGMACLKMALAARGQAWSIHAMRRAVQGLRLKPAKVLVDGNRLPVLDVLAEAIIKGDAKVPAISAASILAKVYRDRWCVAYDEEFPQYGFAVHKGYGTPQHLAALREHGACPQHRKTFSPVTEVLR